VLWRPLEDGKVLVVRAELNQLVVPVTAHVSDEKLVSCTVPWLEPVRVAIYGTWSNPALPSMCRPPLAYLALKSPCEIRFAQSKQLRCKQSSSL
jgi:hypothetical protein